MPAIDAGTASRLTTAAIDCALLNNVRPILSVYPLHPSAIGSNDAQQQAFAAFVNQATLRASSDREQVGRVLGKIAEKLHAAP